MFSYSVPETVVCQGCATEETASLWLILSTGVKPVPPFIQEGGVQTHTCSGCGALTVLDGPLVVLNIGHTPPIAVAPTVSGTEAQDREAINYVLAIVQERMGAAWRTEYLEEAELM